jgi:hypothetical protein
MFKINSIRRKHLLLVGVGLLATALLLIGVLHTLIFLGGWLLFRRAGENKAKAEALQGFMDLVGLLRISGQTRHR